MEQTKSFLQKAINLAVCFTQIKFSIPGLNIGHQLLCRHAPCSSQYSRSCQAALKIKAGTLSSLQIILKNTITLLKPFVRNRTASSLQSGLRELKLNISRNEDFLFCFLLTSFLILIPTYLPPKRPKSFRQSFRLFYTYSHSKIMFGFVFFFCHLYFPFYLNKRLSLKRLLF